MSSPTGRRHELQERAREMYGSRDIAIAFAAQIGVTSARSLTNRLSSAAKLGARRVTIQINSTGGRGDLAVALHNTIRSQPFEHVTTYNMSDVSSGAVLVFLAGDERIVDPTARFLLHAPRLALPVEGSTIDLSEIDLANYTTQLAGIRRQTSEIIAARTGMSIEAADALQSQQFTEIDAPEAVRLGIATRIGAPEHSPDVPLNAIEFRRSLGDPLE